MSEQKTSLQPDDEKFVQVERLFARVTTKRGKYRKVRDATNQVESAQVELKQARASVERLQREFLDASGALERADIEWRRDNPGSHQAPADIRKPLRAKLDEIRLKSLDAEYLRRQKKSALEAARAESGTTAPALEQAFQDYVQSLLELKASLAEIS